MKQSARHFILPIIVLVLLALSLTGFPSGTYAQEPEATPDPGVDAPPPDEEQVPPVTVSEPGVQFDNRIESYGCSSPLTWQVVTPLPEAAYGKAVSSDGIYLYAAGGWNYATTQPTAQFVRYDPSSNDWDVLAPLPIAVSEPDAHYSQGKIYVFGGTNASQDLVNNVQIYTISTGLWSTGAAMPAVRKNMGGGVYNNKIYLVGGYATVYAPSASNQTWEYDPVLDSWSTKADLPAFIAGAGSGVVDGRLYILGGRNEVGDVVKSVYIYSIAGNSWSSGTDLPAGVNYPGSAAYDGKIYIFGGGTPYLLNEIAAPDSPNTTNTSQIYYPASDRWSSGHVLNVGRSFMDGGVVGSSIYAVGGWDGAGSSSVVEKLMPRPLKILIVYADLNFEPDRLKFKLMATPGVGRVDVFDANSITPTYAQLLAYDVVVAFSNYNYNDPVNLGNALANFVDSGGSVVEFAFNFYQGYTPTGQWTTGSYSPLTASSLSFSEVTLGSSTEDHPLMMGVNELQVLHHTIPSLTAGSTQVATWSDGLIAIAVKGRVTAINGYIGDYNGVWSGDFAQVVVNAGNWLSNGSTSCTGLVCNDDTIIHGAITSDDVTQSNRIFRDDPGSTCEGPQTCSVYSSSSYHHYDSFQFWNNTDTEQCVSVKLNPGDCNYALQSAAYLGSYDQNNLCTNFLADIGGSPSANTYKPYSFVVPAWSGYTVVVNEITANTLCPAYTLSVKADNCPVKKVDLPIVIR